MKHIKTINIKRGVLGVNLFFTLLSVTSLFAQQKNTGFKLTNANVRTLETTGFVRCATVEYQEKLAEENPSKTSEAAFESWMSAKIAQVKKNRTNSKIAAQTYTIPVVIHIIHNGDEVNDKNNVFGENISDAQAISQIEVLNQDFRRLENTPGGVNSTGLAVDVEVNFILAKQDPSGLETTGVVRHNIDPYTDDVENTSAVYNDKTGKLIDSGGADWETFADVQRMKTETQWNPEKYLNIWIIRTGGGSANEGEGLDGLLGFAQFPNDSGLGGLDNYEGASATDGVVINFHAFGNSKKSDGSFIMNNIYNEGRTTTHEVGHWLGLRHIWGDTETCGNDDYCLDTPDATKENTSCNIVDSCPFDGLGNDMVQNYMDYTGDPCMDTFTQDQKDRILTVLNNSPRRVELLTSPALNEPLYSAEQLENYVVDPNPVTDKTTVTGSADGIVKLTLYDSYGKVIYSEKFYNVDAVFSEELNLNSLSLGVYMVLIENGSKKIVKRIIKN